jgi:hypothetical protein
MFAEIPESKEVQEQARLEKERADTRILEGRVRRRLAQGKLRLRKTRGERQRHLLGRYFVTDYLGVMPILRRVDLQSLARQLNVWYGDLQLNKHDGDRPRWTQEW